VRGVFRLPSFAAVGLAGDRHVTSRSRISCVIGAKRQTADVTRLLSVKVCPRLNTALNQRLLVIRGRPRSKAPRRIHGIGRCFLMSCLFRREV
jgi:hypothetical protein